MVYLGILVGLVVLCLILFWVGFIELFGLFWVLVCSYCIVLFLFVVVVLFIGGLFFVAFFCGLF